LATQRSEEQIKARARLLEGWTSLNQSSSFASKINDSDKSIPNDTRSG